MSSMNNIGRFSLLIVVNAVSSVALALVVVVMVVDNEDGVDDDGDDDDGVDDNVDDDVDNNVEVDVGAEGNDTSGCVLTEPDFSSV
jgi:hypothetical protein